MSFAQARALSPAEGLLRRLLEAVVEHRTGDVENLLDDNFEARIPSADRDAVLDRSRTVAWLSIFRERRGTMRLEPVDVVRSTPDTVGAIVAHTAFDAPPALDRDQGRSPGEVGVRWLSQATIMTARASEDGARLVELTWVGDDIDGRDKATCEGVVRGWYAAYASQSVRGVLGRLSEHLVARSFHTHRSPERVSRREYQRAFEAWCERSHRGGVLVERVVVHAPYVATLVQFLTQDRRNGQQKMTREVHVLRLDHDLDIAEADFYVTSLCGYPASPCSQ